MLVLLAKHFRAIAAGLAIALMTFSPVAASGLKQTYLCLAGICVGQHEISERQLQRELGGQAVHHFRHSTYCFRTIENSGPVYYQFKVDGHDFSRRVEAVAVSSREICSPWVAPKRRLKSKTREEVGLGTAIKRVKSAYGLPKFELGPDSTYITTLLGSTAQGNESALLYSQENSLLGAVFIFEKDKVIAIEIWNSE